MPQQVTISCPQCGASFQTTIWNTVNTDLYAGVVQDIIDGTFFDSKCPSCGSSSHLEYDLLYHDISRKTMIWVVHRDVDYEARVQEIRAVSMPQGFTTRLVNSVAELREKVVILEAGRNDCVIELMKTLLFDEAAKLVPGLQRDKAHYFLRNKDEFIGFYSSDGEIKNLVFEVEFYERLETLFGETLTANSISPYEIIDASWSYRIAEQCFAILSQTQLDEEQSSVESPATVSPSANISSPSPQAPTEKNVGLSRAAFCHMCGSRLHADAAFCHICGAKTATIKSVAPEIPSTPAPQQPVAPSVQTSIAPPLSEIIGASPASIRTAQKSKKAKKRSKVFLVAIAIFAIIAAVVILLWKPVQIMNTYDLTIDGPSEISVVAGDSHSLSYTLSPNRSDVDVEWRTSDPEVAVISASGSVTGKAEGSSKISVYIDGVKMDTATVSVIKQNVTFVLSLKSETLYQNEKLKIKYELTTNGGETPSIRWVSENTSIATVTSAGVVCAIKPGKTKISAYINDELKGILTINVAQKTSDTSSSTEPAASPSPSASLQAVSPPRSGKIMYQNGADCVAPFGIETSGSGYYLVKLKEYYTGKDVISVFVHGGDNIEIDVPLGLYEVVYASGYTWYGESDLFGPQTVCTKAEDSFRFYEEDGYVNGWTITLYPVTNGNLDTTTISIEDF